MDEETTINSLGCLKISECEVCAKNQAKYTCPRCEVRTCSVECVKIHKKELECSGLRDKVKFKVLRKMDNFDLLNDYRLLEETARIVNKSVRLPGISCTNPVTGALPKDLFRLKCATSKRGVQIHFLPPNFTRRLSNTSHLDYERQDLYWRIDWIFSQADNALVTDEGVLDSVILSSSVYKYINPEERAYPFLSYYQSVGLSGIKLLLKAEKTAPNRFYLLDPTLSLRDNLRGKSIIEYPVIYVVLSEHIYMYDVFSEEEELELQKRQRRRQHNYKRNHSSFKKRPQFTSNGDNSTDEPGRQETSVTDTFGYNVKEKSSHQQGRYKPYNKDRGHTSGVSETAVAQLPRFDGHLSEIDY